MPAPGTLPKSAALRLERTYLGCRESGLPKMNCSRISWSILKKQGWKKVGKRWVI